MKNNIITAMVMVALSAGSAGAQMLPGGKQKSDSPVAIDADNLEVQQNENEAIFTGNVIATQDTMTLKSDKMVVHYRQKSKDAADGDKKDADKAKIEKTRVAGTPDMQSSVSKIDVFGHVFITSPEETAAGDNGVYDVDNKMIHLTSNVVLTKGRNVLKGNTAEYNVATGHSLMVGAGGAVDGQKNRVRGLFIPNQK